MWFVVVGVILQVMNLAGIGPVGAWTWRDHWIEMGLPVALAMAWWFWADTSGWTQRKAMEQVDAKRQSRVDKQMDALGIAPRKKR
jgi:small Trp-rich protein